MANSDGGLLPPRTASFPFPGEILHQIIGYLDPTSLWTLSQTTKCLRQVISPGQNERLEWLLDVECLEQNGGRTELFVDHFNPIRVLTPWEAHVWLCTGCMRLLPHMHFNNHALLQLAYRKPSPSSPAVQALTTWKPTLHGKKWGLEGAKYAASTPVQRCGAKRRHRRCNECLYALGRLTYRPGLIHGFSAGTQITPIQKGRYISFTCAMDRYFPHLGETLGHPSPSNDFLAVQQRHIRMEEFWTMYMVRCSGCGKWQELRGFRFGGMYPAWKPMHDGQGLIRYQQGMDIKHVHLDTLRCNFCFAEEHGAEALGRALQEWLMVSMKLIRWWCDVQLLRGWPAIQFNQRQFRQYKKDIRRLLGDTIQMGGRRYGGGLSYAQVALLSMRHREFSELWAKILATNSQLAQGRMGYDTDFMFWLDHFHECEETWAWLRVCYNEVMSSPELLVNWALSQPQL